MTLTVGSLFAGIGGFDLAFERVGCTVIWQVEIDEYAKRVLAKHWPEVPRYRDIREVSGEQLGYADIICGGFPCQDISCAGKGAGIKGSRSGLWFEMLRIVCEIRPRYVVVENVPALLRRGLGRVLGGLAASGYDAEWDCIPASAVGAPHRRDRVWIVARNAEGNINSTVGGISQGENPEPSGVCEDVAYPNGTRELQPQGAEQDLGRRAGDGGADAADTAGERCQDVQGECAASWWRVEPDVGRVADGIPKRVDRLRCLGNAVVPQVVEWIARRIVEVAEYESRAADTVEG